MNGTRIFLSLSSMLQALERVQDPSLAHHEFPHLSIPHPSSSCALPCCPRRTPGRTTLRKQISVLSEHPATTAKSIFLGSTILPRRLDLCGRSFTIETSTSSTTHIVSYVEVRFSLAPAVTSISTLVSAFHITHLTRGIDERYRHRERTTESCVANS